MEGPDGSIDWMTAPLSRVAHYFREALRRVLLAEAGRRSARLRDAAGCDVTVSARAVRAPECRQALAES